MTMAPNYQLLTKLQKKLKETQPASTAMTLKGLYWCNTGLPHKDCDVSILVTRRRYGRRAFFHGVQHCGSPWSCPVCTIKELQMRQAEITQIINAKRDNEGLFAKMATMTISHSKNQSAAEVLCNLQEAKKIFNHNATKYMRKELPSWRGTITALECKYSEHFGWHWHYHILYFMNEHDAQHFEEIQPELQRRWFHAGTKASGYNQWDAPSLKKTMKQQAGYYISKQIVTTGSYIAKEMAKPDNGKKWSVAPMQLLMSDSPRDNDLFFEYALAAKRKARITYSCNLRKYVNEEEIRKNLNGNEHLSTTLVCTWSSDDWSEIINHEFSPVTDTEKFSIRRRLLVAAELDGASGVVDVCDAYGLPFPKIYSWTTAECVEIMELQRAAAAARYQPRQRGKLIPLTDVIEADEIYNPEEWRRRNENIAENRKFLKSMWGIDESGEQVTINCTATQATTSSSATPATIPSAAAAAPTP